MNRLAVVLLSFASVSLASGCFLYIDDDDPCDFGGIGGDQAFEPGKRNPASGQCEFRGGPVPCNDECGPCLLAEPAPLEDDPSASWAFCDGQCSFLDETTCLGTDACRGIYNEALGFEACWGTDFTGPVPADDCTQYDANECSRRDACFAIHASPCAADRDPTGAEAPSCELGEFISCGNEDDPNDPGHCYAELTCDSEPPNCPADTLPGIRNGCWSGYCIPVAECERQASCDEIVAEASCIARTDCAPAYQGIDCVCDEVGCTCAEHVFDSCSAAPSP